MMDHHHSWQNSIPLLMKRTRWLNPLQFSLKTKTNRFNFLRFSRVFFAFFRVFNVFFCCWVTWGVRNDLLVEINDWIGSNRLIFWSFFWFLRSKKRFTSRTIELVNSIFFLVFIGFLCWVICVRIFFINHSTFGLI